MAKKKNDDEPRKPRLKFRPYHSFAPADMPDHQPGTYGLLARLSNEMGRADAFKTGKPMSKAEFFRALFHRAGMQDPRRKR